MRLAETPDPVAGPGEVVLNVHYAGLNPADSYLASRQYPVTPKFPHILGRDGLGTVVAVGEGVREVREGEVRMILRGDVGGNRPGTFAGKVAVPADQLVPKPSSWTDEEAGGAVLVYLTAYQALTMWGPLPAGANVLVTGASGGVGLASVQLGKAMGYSVYGLSRSAEKGARLVELGATATYDPEDPDWRRKLKERLQRARIDLAIDNIGGKLFPQVIDTLGDQGKASLVGRLAGPVPEFNTATLFFRRIRIGGVAVGAYTATEAKNSWEKVLQLMESAKARPVVDSVFAFDQLVQAFDRLQRGPFGKVLLKVR
jgi:NADPH2:quinone reductase